MNNEERLKLRALLRDIWAEFRASYYDNDQEIIAYLAYLLTRDLPPITLRLQPEGPRPDRHPVNEAKVVGWLAEAEQMLGNEGGLATFFDRYILFQSSNFGVKEGAYPIPRHIIDFMLELFSIKPDQKFADFACGTGGFLVHWHKLNPQHGLAMGIDISPEMAGLAEANAILHGMTSQDTILGVGDAFGVGGLIKAELQHFDRIAMAPSFGHSVNPVFAENLFGPKAGRSSELLFVRLAVEKLTDNGEAIVMVPLSMGSTNVSQNLRRSLVEESTLGAVITLDAGMLQPFSNQPVSLWLMEKQPRTSPGYTWFLQIARDGYPLTADRDLTADPSEWANDLPGAIAVMRAEATWDEAREFSTISLQETQTVERVLLIKVREQATLFSIRHFPSGASSSQSLVIQSTLQDGPSLATIIPFNKEGFMLANIQDSVDFLTWRRQEFRTASSEEEDIADTLIFSGGKAGQIIALTADGRLLGFTKSSVEIAEAAYRLNDSTYRDFHQTPVLIQRSVVQSLQEISTRQRIIAAYSESLLGQVEIKSLLKEALPPALLNVTSFPLLAYLDSEQQTIWDEVRKKRTDEQDHALHFTPADIPGYTDRMRRVKINQTLQLLEALGLIVQVSIKVGELGNERRLLCYRHVTTFDAKKW